MSIIFLTGMIGYVAGIKIAYKIAWKILFLVLLFVYSFSFVAAIMFERTGLLMLMLLVPAMYALYAYAYRSRHIW